MSKDLPRYSKFKAKLRTVVSSMEKAFATERIKSRVATVFIMAPQVVVAELCGACGGWIQRGRLLWLLLT